MKCQSDISYGQFCFEIWKEIWKMKQIKWKNLNWSKNAQYSKSESNMISTTLWKMCRQLAKIAPNAYPDTSMNPGQLAQKDVQNWLRSDKICALGGLTFNGEI